MNENENPETPYDPFGLREALRQLERVVGDMAQSKSIYIRNHSYGKQWHLGELVEPETAKEKARRISQEDLQRKRKELRRKKR